MPRSFVDQQRYTVRPGDTLGGIAAAHGTTVAALVAANSGLIDDPNLIQAGWELLIPGTVAAAAEPAADNTEAPAGEPVQTYTVQPGDTLSAIANRWDTTVRAIADLNGIANPNVLAVGQRLVRPGGTASAEPAEPADASATADPRSSLLRFERMPLDMPPAVMTGGYREDYGGYLHRGIDIGGAPVGTPIFAPAAGIVTVHRPGDGWGSGGFGICVILDHPGTPWWSIYGHMSETNRANGDRVAAGDQIGAVGFTGKVIPPGPAGAHLHWQLSAHAGFPPDFQYIANPLDFLRG